jgi:hypothetical protein
MIWAGSPRAGTAIADALVRWPNQRRTAADVRSQVIGAVTNHAANVIASRVSKHVRNVVVNQVASQVAGQVLGPVKYEIDQCIERRLAGAGYGQHDAHWLSYFDALGRYGLDVSPLEGLMEIAASCGWWWPFEDVCVLTERHALVARDELITVARIQRETNVEVRRVLLAGYGFDRYLHDSGALPIHADETGTLYRCDMEGDEPLVVVSVGNSTREHDASRTRYVRVPPDITEAREAVAWTFDRRADEYRPVLES